MESSRRSERGPVHISFEHVQNGYDGEKCERKVRLKLLSRLTAIGKGTWLDLKMKSRQRGGAEKIDQSTIRKEMPASITQDVELLSIRIENDGLGRLIGFRENQLLHLVWVDCKGELYDHG